MWEWPQTVHILQLYTLIQDVGVATNSTHTTVVHTYSRCGSGHKQYTLIVDVGVATNSTHTKVVHTNSRRGSGHKQYMCPSGSAS